MAAGTYHLAIEQGAVFARTFAWTTAAGDPVALDGYTAAMQLRAIPQGPVVADWSGSLAVQSPGAVALHVAATETALLTVHSGVYDLELTPPSGPADTFRFLQGMFNVSREVTRDV
jgi:hypothetical protein